MRLNNLVILGLLILTSSCKTNSNSPHQALPVAGLINGNVLDARTGDNVMKLTVNGSTCRPNSYPNKPCVSITLCDTGADANSSSCTVVNDILVDTGSYGLRVFKSAIPNRIFTQVTSHQGGALAECSKFGDGSSEWGPVQLASVVLGNEAAVQVPIQVLDSTFGSVPSSCGTPDASADKAGFNGILGVGLFNQDCGMNCTGSHISSGIYFTCSGGNTGNGTGLATCVGGSADRLSDEVQNPVAQLPRDNNGVIIELPAIPSEGAKSVEGYLILGIGTEANNQPSQVSVYNANPQKASFTANFKGQNYLSFLDTGSNGLYFPLVAAIPTCSATSNWYCPANAQNFSANNIAFDGSVSGAVNFQVANAAQLFRSGQSAFNNLGGAGGNIFDWGLPFYFGRNIYLGIENTSSSLGVGPYWAY